jgi:hypothetical protein
LHSPDYVCDEIGDLLVALSKCLNAPILIVVEIHGAIHVLIHAAISVPEVVPAHLDPLQELAVRPDLVRAAPLALAMMIVAVIHVEIPVVVTEIGPRVVNLAIVPVAIVVRAVTVLAAIVIGLLAVTDLTHVATPVVAIVQPEIVVQEPIVVRVVNMVIVPFVVMIHVAILVVAIVIVHRVASSVIDRLVIVHRAVISAIVTVHRAAILVTDLLVIVGRVVNMVTDRFVVTTVLTLVVAIVIVPLAVILVTVIVHRAVSSVIDRPAVMIQALPHVAATETVLLVAMAQALVAHRARVVMTAVMPETEMTGAVVLVVRISRLADQRTKPNVVVKPCAHVAAVKCVKTANKLRCHAKQRPGLMKAELKTKSAMPPKVQCAERSHRDAPCRRDQKMKMN